MYSWSFYKPCNLEEPSNCFHCANFAKKASTASVVKYQYKDWNLCNLALWTLTNLLIVCEPHILSKNSKVVCQSYSHPLFSILNPWNTRSGQAIPLNADAENWTFLHLKKIPASVLRTKFENFEQCSLSRQQPNRHNGTQQHWYHNITTSA